MASVSARSNYGLCLLLRVLGSRAVSVTGCTILMFEREGPDEDSRVPRFSKKVRMGEHDLYDDTDGPVVDVTPRHILVHDNYTGRPTYANDIALIELQTAVNYTGRERHSPITPVAESFE